MIDQSLTKPCRLSFPSSSEGSTLFKTSDETKEKPSGASRPEYGAPSETPGPGKVISKPLSGKLLRGRENRPRYQHLFRGQQLAPQGLALPLNEERFQDSDWLGDVDSEEDGTPKLSHFRSRVDPRTDRVAGHRGSPIQPYWPFFANTAARWDVRKADHSFGRDSESHSTTRYSDDGASDLGDYVEPERPAGLMVLQGKLPDELKIQIEEDAMLRNWASQRHSRGKRFHCCAFETFSLVL